MTKGTKRAKHDHGVESGVESYEEGEAKYVRLRLGEASVDTNLFGVCPWLSRGIGSAVRMWACSLALLNADTRSESQGPP